MTVVAPTSAAPTLPGSRGPLSELLIERLALPRHELPAASFAQSAGDPLTDDDLQLALYVAYELHYRSFAGVDAEWEWEPSLIALRAAMERQLEGALRAALPPEPPSGDLPGRLRAILDGAAGPSLSRYLETRATLDQFREFVVHRSAYQLKEADPHSWSIPRLEGRSKVALVEIQFDEYGGGRPDRQHARLFARTMEGLGLDGSYGAYLDAIPGTTLATVNAMSLFGLHRRLRGAIVGHLAALEMDSTLPNRRYGNALRRLGIGAPATDFFDEHVEADAVHESLAAHDLAAGLAEDDPSIASDIAFGARAMVLLDQRVAERTLACWSERQTSLRRPLDLQLRQPGDV